MLDILLEDGPLLAVNKPAGLLTLGAIPGVPTLERQVKAYLKQKYDKPGNVYLGIPHRLDRPVSGVVVFARNSKAAARLHEQFAQREVRKVYWALVENRPDPAEGRLVDWLLKVPDESRVEIVAAGTAGAREARLSYRVIQPANDPNLPTETGGSPVEAGQPCPSWVEVELETGRMHQIRVQFAGRGWPVVGDMQYGAVTRMLETPPGDRRDEPIGLHARSLTLRHPVRYDEVTIAAPLPAFWNRFGSL
jgi:23S rRNA pseudouridine1911/1915/1917 synthase